MPAHSAFAHSIRSCFATHTRTHTLAFTFQHLLSGLHSAHSIPSYALLLHTKQSFGHTRHTCIRHSFGRLSFSQLTHKAITRTHNHKVISKFSSAFKSFPRTHTFAFHQFLSALTQQAFGPLSATRTHIHSTAHRVVSMTTSLNMCCFDRFSPNFITFDTLSFLNRSTII